MTVLSRFSAHRPKAPVAEVPQGESAPDPIPSPGPDLAIPRRILEAKVRLHRKLIDDINLPSIEKASGSELRSLVGEMVSRYVLDERLPVNAGELENLVDELIDE